MRHPAGTERSTKSPSSTRPRRTVAAVSRALCRQARELSGRCRELDETALDDAQHATVRLVARLGDELTEALADLHAFAHGADGSRGHEPFNLHAAVRAAVAKQVFVADRLGVRLLCRVAANVPSIVLGDDPGLRRTLATLLSQALRSTPRRELIIELALDPATGPDHVRITFRGEGAPVDREVSRWPIERLNGTPPEGDDVPPIEAMRLAMVHGFLAAHEGTLTLDRDGGFGGRLTCRLRARALGRRTKPSRPTRRVDRVLVVSADPDATCSALVNLSTDGIQVDHVESMDDVPERVRRDGIDLVLVDGAAGGAHLATFAASAREGSVAVVGLPRVGSDGSGPIDTVRLGQIIRGG